MIVFGKDWPRHCWRWALVVAVVPGFLLAGPASLVTASPAMADCATSFVIDFAGLPAGTILDDEYAGQGVQISAVANGAGFPNTAIVFDSNVPSSHDPDLSVGVGNISILANNLTDSDNNGLVDDPDENNNGGKQIYAFDEPVHIGSFLFIDKDHGTPDHAIAYDGSNSIITQATIPLAGDGSVQTINVNADGVRRLEIVYRDSAALTGIEVSCTATPTPSASPSPSPTPSPIPSATPGPTPSPSPSATLGTTPTATAIASPPATPTPAATLAAASATPTTTPTALAVSLPAAGGKLSLRDQRLKLTLVGSVPLGMLAAGFLLALRSPRRGRGA